MEEYVVGIKPENSDDAPSDWMDKVCTHRGVIKRAANIERILIKSSKEIIEQLEDKFPYLKVEWVMPYLKDDEKKK